MRWGWGVLAGVALLGLPVARAQEGGTIPAAPGGTLRKLDKAATELAKIGRAADVERCCALLEQLGKKPSAVAKLRAKLVPAAKQVAPGRPPKKALKAIDAAVAALAKHMEAQPEASRGAVARLLLQLDAQHPGANGVLGHVQHEGRWMSAAAKAQAARRHAIEQMLAKARELPVEITKGPGSHPILTALGDEPAVAYRWGDVQVISRVPEPKVRRMFRESMRTRAVLQWVMTGTLEIPPASKTVVLLANNAEMLRARAIAIKAGLLTPSEAKVSEGASNFFTTQYHAIAYPMTEARFEVSMMLWPQADLTNWLRVPALTVGLENWVTLRYLGTPRGEILATEMLAGKDAGAGGGTESSGGAKAGKGKEAELLIHLARGGILGCRSYMRYLVEHDADPPWANSMVRFQTMVGGNDVFKCTLMVDWLLERGPLGPLWEAVRNDVETREQRIRAFESALKKPLTALDEEWRRWLMDDGGGGIRGRVAGGSGALPPGAAECVQYLRAIRRAAMKDVHEANWRPVEADLELSEGCLLHAKYLTKHPGQAERWPDAHEEYPDKEGFTPEGARGGGAGVIAPGSSNAVQAIDSWMGTVYHRWPLLEAGLLRVGWGLSGGFAVMDTGSLVGGAPATDIRAIWPPDKRRDVPLRFAPELPNPVPGEDQAKWGYPVTLQLFPNLEGLTPGCESMELRVDSADGEPVECWFIHPERPYNVELAPPNRYALIPKATLRPKTTYWASAVIAGGERLRWSFKTK